MHTIQLAMLLVGGVALVSAALGEPEKPSAEPQKAVKFKKVIHKTVQSDYLLYLPSDYGKDKSKHWPLVLFLHGAGERGEDVTKVKAIGPPRMVEDGKQFPFIMVSPQCPTDSWWDKETDALIALLDEIESKYSIDQSRVYLTGLSMGGYGTWTLATIEPKRFAAIAPICGGGNPKRAPLIKDIPIWAFHGDADKVVPVAQTIEMIEAIKAAGGNPKCTIYPGINHDSWTATYNNEDFWKWLLDQRRK